MHTFLTHARLVIRGIALISLLLIYTAAWVVIGRLPKKYQARPLRFLHAGLIKTCGIRICTQGQSQAGSLGVINHISWLDAHVVGAALSPLQFSAFVTKADVQGWPVVGSLIKNAGAIFIRRGANQTATLRPQIANALRAGHAVFFFPEATTLPGDRLGYFFPRLLAAAQDTGALIQPVALRYKHAPGEPATAPFVGHVSFLDHLVQLLKAPYVEAVVTFLPPIDSQQPRRELVNQLRNMIAQELGIVVADKQEDDINIHEYCDYLRDYI